MSTAPPCLGPVLRALVAPLLAFSLLSAAVVAWPAREEGSPVLSLLPRLATAMLLLFLLALPAGLAVLAPAARWWAGRSPGPDTVLRVLLLAGLLYLVLIVELAAVPALLLGLDAASLASLLEIEAGSWPGLLKTMLLGKLPQASILLPVAAWILHRLRRRPVTLP